MSMIKCPNCNSDVDEQEFYCGECGYKIKDTEEHIIPNISTNTQNEAATNKLRNKKSLLIFLAIVIGIIAISLFAVVAKWNVIMGYQNCKSGDYMSAVKYYAQEINKGKADKNIIERYNALSAYLSAENAYSNDDMGELSKCLDTLNSTTSLYPTKIEIDTLKEQYTQRSNEINSYDKTISEISELFSDTSKLNEIKTKCDELLNKNTTKAQKNKLEDMKTNATNFIDIKSSYDKADYESVVTKVLELPDTYKSYATKNEIENMRNEAQKIVDEKKLVASKLKTVRESFNSGNYDSSLYTANELLELNLTTEERQEVETIKSTSEQKIAEEKAAAEQAEREARQKMIDEAIKISATDLYEAFTTNKVGADNKYKGKTLLVTGTIYNVDKAWLIGTPYVTLKAGYVADGVTAYFSSDTSSQLTDLSQGQTVKILGKCGGRSLGVVTLNDCNIIN